jgi:hypothetical protein
LLAGSRADGAQIPLQWEFAVEEIHLEQSGQYTSVFLKDAVLLDDTSGNPWLPAKYITVLMPPGANFKDLKIQIVEEICIARDVYVYPAQEPQPVSSAEVPFIAPNPKAYADEEKTPALVASIEGTHNFHGYILISIRLNPVRYLPYRRELYLATQIVANLVYEAGNGSRMDSNLQSHAYREVKKMISNPLDLERFYPLTQTGVLSNGQREKLSETLKQSSGVTYLLITSKELLSAFQALVDWRTLRALEGKLVTVEYIYRHYGGVDEQDKIRNCIKAHHENNGTVYVTLGGDDTVVPDRDCYVVAGAKTVYDMPTDLYYGGLDGTWDEDGDGIYGEAGEDEADLYPEVWVGRIPVRSAQQARDYVDKVIAYESRSPDGFSQTMLLAGGMGVLLTGTKREEGFLDHEPVSTDERGMVRRYRDDMQPYWQATPLHKLIDTKSSWDIARSGDYDYIPEHLIECLNSGYHHVWLRAHGNTTIYGTEHGRFKSKDALALTNNGRFSIIYGDGCTTGAFDLAEPSISEAFLRCPQGGAVVYVGCSRINYGPHHDLFYREIFVNKRERIGEVFGRYKMAWAQQSGANGWQRWVQFGRNLQGDSALKIMGTEFVRDLHLSSPEGCEVIEQGTDLTIRWNASGTDFSTNEKVNLDYSSDSGQHWQPIPMGHRVPYNSMYFQWSNCPLPVGTHYRVRVLSLSDPSVNDMSNRDFTIGKLVILTVQTNPIENVTINLSSDTINQSNIFSDFDITVLEGATVNVSAPEVAGESSEYAFVQWKDEKGNTMATTKDYTFILTEDKTIVAEYAGP